jgi:hypothetical protein
VRVVDVMRSQDRVIIWLDCKHTVSVTAREAQADPALLERLQATLHQPGTWPCSFCPDVTAAESRQEKSAIQLWREQGEPDE